MLLIIPVIYILNFPSCLKNLCSCFVSYPLMVLATLPTPILCSFLPNGRFHWRNQVMCPVECPTVWILTDCSLWCWISQSCILSSPWGTTNKLVVGTEGLVKFRSNFSSFILSFQCCVLPSWGTYCLVVPTYLCMRLRSGSLGTLWLC